MVRQGAVVAVAALVVASCGASTPRSEVADTRPPGTPLAAGLVVAPGSRLVGPVFTFPDSIGTIESVAVLAIDLDADPLAVYDDYAAQARELGIPIAASGTTGPHFPACVAAVGDRDVLLGDADPAATRWLRCDTYGPLPSGGTVSLHTTWGGNTHHALVDVVRGVPAQPSSLSGTTRAEPFRPLPAVTDRSSVSAPGTPFGEEHNAFAAGYRRFTLEPGSRVVADAANLADQLDVVLRVDGDPETVLRGYARQLGRGGTTPEVEHLRTDAGEVLRVAASPLGGGGANLVTDPSGRWILVRVNSD